LPGKTPKDAEWALVERLQRAFGCVTHERLSFSGGNYRATEPLVLLLGDGSPIELHGAARVSLTFQMHYRIVEGEGVRGPWKTTTSGYLYGLDDADGREILEYHWHPSGHSEETSPHLHLGAGAHVGRAELPGAHLPTGRVAVEDVLYLAITVFGVEPLHAAWQDVLADSKAAFEAYRTWPAPVDPSGA